MTTLILLAAAFCAAATILHLVSVATLIARMRRSNTCGRASEQVEGVTIIRPVCGIENFAAETLTSTFYLDHPSYEVVFCVAHGDDPVLPLLHRLVAAYAYVPARVLVGYDRISTNPKLNNIVKGWEAARHPWIVMADSNVLMPPDYIRRLLDTWQRGTGLVCSPPVGCLPDGISAELECAFLNTYQARWQCFADSLGLGFAQGKTMLWRRDILQAAGGIRALADEVAEDAASTKIVRKQGLRVRLVDRPFSQPLGYRTFSEVWNRQLRWARLRRDTFKPAFLLEILAGGFPPAVACAVCISAADGPVIPVVAGFACAWYLAEALLAYAAGWHMSWRSVALWPLRDLLLPVLWVVAWMGNEFVWRGNVMRVADRGSTA